MLAAIQFNHQFFAQRTKINNIVSNSMLSSKMHTISLMRAQS